MSEAEMDSWQSAAAAFDSPADLVLLAKCRMHAWAIRGKLPGPQEMAALRRGYVPGSRVKSPAWCVELLEGGNPCAHFAWGESPLCHEHAKKHREMGEVAAAKRIAWCQARREGREVEPQCQGPRPCKRCGQQWDRSASRNCRPCARERDRLRCARLRELRPPKLCTGCGKPHPAPNEKTCPKCTTDTARWYREHAEQERAKARERARRRKAEKMHERRLEHAIDD